MREILLAVAAALFVGGYFVMDRLDRFLEQLRPENAADEGEHEIADGAEVENPCLPCYNMGCKDRVRYPAGRFTGQEGQAWKQPDKARTGFLGQVGMTAGHRGS